MRIARCRCCAPIARSDVDTTCHASHTQGAPRDATSRRAPSFVPLTLRRIACNLLLHRGAFSCCQVGITWGMLPFGGTPLPDPLVVGEAFNIMDGESKMIQAVMRYQPVAEWNE